MLHSALNSIGDGVIVVDREGRFLFFNAAAEKLLGMGPLDTTPDRWTQQYGIYLPDQAVPYPPDELPLALAMRGEIVDNVEVWVRNPGVPEGTWLRGSARPLRSEDGTLRGAVLIFRDITEQKKAKALLQKAHDELELMVRERTAELARRNEELQAEIAERNRTEAALRQVNQTLGALVHSSPLAIAALDLDGNVLNWNPAAERMFGWAREEVLRRPLPTVPETEAAAFREGLARVKRGENAYVSEVRRRKKDGSLLDVQVWAATLHDATGTANGYLGVMIDVTERKRLEEQLRQAQKMETLGRLAGGIAHDFNNLLTVILGHADLLLSRLSPQDGRLYADIWEIKSAADSAASLTQQLLASSRQQILEPKVLDLNPVITGIENMLRRLIGEDIALVTALQPALGHVKVDQGQIEQVILNLALNARDAMPAGGRLVIETADVVLGEDYCSMHPGSAPGPHVMLAVSDTGCGMDRETLSRIFEPFFTTKERGEGTGLGLSTVLGIVKQHEANIGVYSEPGRGTAFKVYLPRVDEPVETLPEHPPSQTRAQAIETILVVEDEDKIRGLVREILSAEGYTVLDAANGPEALALSRNYPGLIHLLLTDLVIPQMSGGQLAAQLTAQRPGLRVLYMSGYTEDAVLRYGRLGPGICFLQKPFLPEGLKRKVREVLDARAAKPILIVDDDAGVRGVLRGMLNAAGYEVVEASEGAQAERQIEERPVDLAIIDLIMPDQEGLETIEHLRKYCPALQIIAMSGAVEDTYLEVARRLGAHATLQKPLRATEVLKAVGTALGERLPEVP